MKENMPGTRDVVIRVDNIKKSFKSYKDKATSFKERFIKPSRGKHEDVVVLKGISFEVRKGEAIGLIGKNGCGKSTTLKMLTRILYPNEGNIEIAGRVSSLIELGAGFHPDMTGRENIYTNASIFGITRKEVDRRLNDIIRFSELEEYIDNPVRTYSSGMYMRLAFAVAINVDADVLLIDEILAVGDSAFQKKCFEKLKEIKANGTTIVIVSHSMDQMYKICDRLIWIENGLIKDEGVPRIIGEEYLAEMEGRRLDRIELERQQKKAELEKKIREEQERLRVEQEREQKKQEEKRLKEEERKRKEEEERARREELEQMERRRREMERNETLKKVCQFCHPGARRQGSGEIYYTHVSLIDVNGRSVNEIKTWEKYTLVLEYEAKKSDIQVRFVIGVTRDDGIYCYGSYIDIDEKKQAELKRKGKLEFAFENKLLKGNYFLDLWITDFAEKEYDAVYGLMEFKVGTTPYLERGFLAMEHSWSLNGNELSGEDKEENNNVSENYRKSHLKTVVRDEICGICGNKGKFEIGENAVLLREAVCEHCKASLRNSDTAKQIVAAYTGNTAMSLIEFAKNCSLRILNTCSSGYLHETLKSVEGYIACEYFNDVPNGKWKGNVMCVDLQDIPFPDESFDLVISEDVFEHVNEYKKAFREVYRVLRTKGCHIFTIPIHEGRKTVSRIGNPKEIYHGDPLSDQGCIVITDFGDDVLNEIDEIGFESILVRAHTFYTEDQITDSDVSYNEYLQKRNKLEEYFRYNSLVIISYKK